MTLMPWLRYADPMLSLVFTTCVVLAAGLDESPAYQEGLALYQELEFEQAIGRFRAAAAEPGRSDEERAVLLVWEAMARAGVGDDEGARTAARAALELHLDVEPPELAPPKVIGFLDELRPEVEAATRAAAAEAAPPPVEDPPAPTPASPAGSDELPLLLIGGGTAMGLGVVGLAGAGLFAALTAASLTTAADPDAFQVDAQGAVDAANLQVATAIGLGVVGVALVGVGGALVALDVTSAE